MFLVSAALAHQSFAQSLNENKMLSLSSIFGESFDPWADPGSNNFAPATPGDSDLGEQLVLAPPQESQPFSVELSENIRWTSNAGLSDLDVRTELEDIYSATDLRFSYLPSIGENTFFEFGTGYALYRYLDNSSLNFDRFEASVGLIHSFQNVDNLIGWTRFKHHRLLSSFGSDELFTDYNVELGLYYTIPLGAKQLAYGVYTFQVQPRLRPW